MSSGEGPRFAAATLGREAFGRPSSVALGLEPLGCPSGAPASLAWARAGRGFIGAALQTAEAFFLEPEQPGPAVTVAAAPGQRPTVAVFGLARGCGSTVVARALAAELAERDAGGAAAVMCEARAAGIPLATQAATRLARACEEVPGASARAVGRLALVRVSDPLSLAEGTRGLAPLVLDAGSMVLGGVPAALADRTVVVTTPALEPALARVAAECLARVGPAPVIVLNRANADPDRPGDQVLDPRGEQPQVALPDSRMGAQLALGGREARGDLGRAISVLADVCEQSP